MTIILEISHDSNYNYPPHFTNERIKAETFPRSQSQPECRQTQFDQTPRHPEMTHSDIPATRQDGAVGKSGSAPSAASDSLGDIR